MCGAPQPTLSLRSMYIATFEEVAAAAAAAATVGGVVVVAGEAAEAAAAVTKVELGNSCGPRNAAGTRSTGATRSLPLPLPLADGDGEGIGGTEGAASSGSLTRGQWSGR